MTVELKPEIEALIQKRCLLQCRGGNRARSFGAKKFNEDWLAHNRDEISTEIQEGWDEAQRGELIDRESVRAEMQEFKEDWKSNAGRHDPVLPHPEGEG